VRRANEGLVAFLVVLVGAARKVTMALACPARMASLESAGSRVSRVLLAVRAILAQQGAKAKMALVALMAITARMV